MSAKKKAGTRAPQGARARLSTDALPSTPARVDLDPATEASLKDRELCGIRDADTGRTWQWRESDFPGLSNFLLYWMVSWHPLAHREFRRNKASIDAIRSRAAERRLNNPAHDEVRRVAAEEAARQKWGYLKRTCRRVALSEKAVKNILNETKQG